MIFDNYALIANNLAYNGTPGVIDTAAAALSSTGQDISLSIQGHSLGGVTAFVLNDGPTAAPATTRMTIAATAAQLNAGPIEVPLPSNVQRYFTVVLVGATSGAWSCGVVLLNTQTNK